MSFDLFAYKQLRDTVSDCEDRYDEIERRIRFPQKASLAEEKQSMEFINLMERYLVELEDRLMNFKDVEYKLGFLLLFHCFLWYNKSSEKGAENIWLVIQKIQKSSRTRT